jgi:hypothetical protein
MQGWTLPNLGENDVLTQQRGTTSLVQLWELLIEKLQIQGSLAPRFCFDLQATSLSPIQFQFRATNEYVPQAQLGRTWILGMQA